MNTLQRKTFASTVFSAGVCLALTSVCQAGPLVPNIPDSILFPALNNPYSFVPTGNVPAPGNLFVRGLTGALNPGDYVGPNGLVEADTLFSGAVNANPVSVSVLSDASQVDASIAEVNLQYSQPFMIRGQAPADLLTPGGFGGNHFELSDLSVDHVSDLGLFPSPSQPTRSADRYVQLADDALSRGFTWEPAADGGKGLGEQLYDGYKQIQQNVKLGDPVEWAPGKFAQPVLNQSEIEVQTRTLLESVKAIADSPPIIGEVAPSLTVSAETLGTQVMGAVEGNALFMLVAGGVNYVAADLTAQIYGNSPTDAAKVGLSGVVDFGVDTVQGLVNLGFNSSSLSPMGAINVLGIQSPDVMLRDSLMGAVGVDMPAVQQYITTTLNDAKQGFNDWMVNSPVGNDLATLVAGTSIQGLTMIPETGAAALDLANRFGGEMLSLFQTDTQASQQQSQNMQDWFTGKTDTNTLIWGNTPGLSMTTFINNVNTVSSVSATLGSIPTQSNALNFVTNSATSATSPTFDDDVDYLDTDFSPPTNMNNTVITTDPFFGNANPNPATSWLPPTVFDGDFANSFSQNTIVGFAAGSMGASLAGSLTSSLFFNPGMTLGLTYDPSTGGYATVHQDPNNDFNSYSDDFGNDDNYQDTSLSYDIGGGDDD